MRPPGKTQPQHILVCERRMAALRLRQMGLTYRAIVDVMHNDPAWHGRLPTHYRERHAHFDVVQAFASQREALAETVALVRQTELDRLDRMLVGVWSRAQSGDDRAIASVLAIMARRERLLPGLAMPQHVALTAPGGADTPASLEDRAHVAYQLAQYGLSQHANGHGRGDEPE